MALAGLGIGLPYPPQLGPPLPTNQPYQPLGTRVDVPAGGAFYIPAGWFIVRTGQYTQTQFLDPGTGTWQPFSQIGRDTKWINSDGGNFRIVNPTGCPIGALVTANGTGYAQTNTTAVLSVGNSAWQPVVGNSLTGITVGNDPKGNAGGTNFTLPPIVDIPPPPPGGVPASATATLSAGAVASVTMLNEGAGYTSGAVTPLIRPNPFDPNIGTITVPALTTTLAGGTAASGGVNALLCTNYGSVLSGSQMAGATLTISGNGASATATPVFCMAVTAVALSASGGAAYPGTAVDVDTVGGTVTTAAASVFNPGFSTGLLIPRKANIYAPVSGGVVQAAVIVDGGLFQVAPSAIVLAQAAASAGLPTTATAATLTMGGVTDSVWLQQLGGWF